MLASIKLGNHQIVTVLSTSCFSDTMVSEQWLNFASKTSPLEPVQAPALEFNKIVFKRHGLTFSWVIVHSVLKILGSPIENVSSRDLCHDTIHLSIILTVALVGCL